MSAAKLEYAPYKLFEPEYYPQRPIIIGVDEGLDSPETATLKYEEAAARANGGGDVRGDSPPGLLPTSFGKQPQTQIHGFESTRGYQHEDAAYASYAPQPFAPQQADDTDNVGQDSFASSTPVGSYLAGVTTELTIYACPPTSGPASTKLVLKVSCPYDLLAMTQPAPYFYIAFGSRKCQAAIMRNVEDGTGSFAYTITAEAPHFSVTGCQTASVPVSLVIDDPSGQELSRTAAGAFLYHDVPVAGTGANTGDITRRKSKSPERHHHPDSTPKSAAAAQLAHDPTTNNFAYPAGGETSQQSSYNASFPQTGDDAMLTTYRTSSFTETFPRVPPPPPLRSPSSAWPAYGSSVTTPRSAALSHVHSTSSITRPPLTPLPASSSTTPQLIRTSTLQSPGNNGAAAYNPYAMYTKKAVLKIIGKLDTMAENWTTEEWDNRRRIVLFRKTQSGSTLTATFKAISVNERPPNSICISCIWWAEKNECFVTSVDTIHLLEQLVAAPSRFTVEEKNRIRRNLEGFRPLTVSKAKPESEEFFKLIMAFPNPKPRNIEKDVKVFPWKILEPALKKIIGKYSASPSSTIPPSILTPVSAPYPTLPTPPILGPGPSDPVAAYGVAHHDAILSPRPMPGASSLYSTFPGPVRTLSPANRTSSPLTTGLRTTPLPPVTTYDNRPLTTSSYSTGLHGSLVHPPPSTTSTSRWETPPTTYAESYPTLGPHHTSSHQMYGPSTYGESHSRT